ncbi:long-chain-fatty-acid--CoA ligase [Variovorax sp. J22R133]|uniref:long-chain-fatty-acid--CoA ligase n=1 Tax=Variovorax brevis TaxID=3053503 RepID=UPI002578F973|nr:long-chain-fatty-acid--CoA ligase [Variovorax sp. J22R133]MDM0114043.1 long-chain-fatty-acid--CoA ligase [Variovorax sp. J22R133]
MQLTQSLRRSAQITPRRTSTVYGERRRTWSETANRVARLAGGIAAMGLQPGERVMILASNSDRYIESVFAVLWAGCVVVPANTRWAPAEHAYALQDSVPTLFMVDQDFVEMARKLPGVDARRTIYMGDDAQADLVSYESLIADNAPLADRASEGDAMAAIMYTGGTTGFPKGVMLSHNNLALAPMSFALECPYEQDTVFLHVAPMFHLAALSSMFSYTSAGATQVIAPRFDPALICNMIAGEKVNMTLMVPTMIDFIDRYLQAVPTDVSSLRKMIYGAAPISEALLRRVMKSLPNVQLYQGYGQTEMSGGVVVLRPEFHVVEGANARLLRSAGRASIGVDIRIVDDEMNEVPRGTVGEIAARGSTVMLGYWNKPEQTRAAIVDGWLRSGDAACMDDDGFVFIVDRMKDMIVSGGENVYSAEVENALSRHPAVLECAVIGIPHEKWGEAVHAEVRLRDGQEIDEEALSAHCAELIAGYKRPRSFNFRKDPLPLSAAGKILKNELRKPYWEGQARSIA